MNGGAQGWAPTYQQQLVNTGISVEEIDIENDRGATKTQADFEGSS